MTPLRKAALFIAVPLLAVSACSSSTKTAAAPTSVPAVPTSATTAAAAPPSQSSPSTAPSTSPTASPASASAGVPAVGSYLSGAGTMLTAPTAATTKPFSRDCGSLVDGGFSQTQCVTSSSPGGFIASFIETSKTGNEVRYLTYREVGSSFKLVLRSDVKDLGTKTNPILVKSDLNEDGDPKAVLGIPSTNGNFLQTLDVIDTSGLVVIHLDLNGGFAKASDGGGLDAWFPSPKGGYLHDIIRYIAGHWTVISQEPESDSQALPNDEGGFSA